MRRSILVAAFLVACAVSVASYQVPELGAPLDPALFTFHRIIPDGPPGAVALVVDPATLAHSRGPVEHFADVRILDSANRQVPYVVEHRDDPLVVPLAPERADPPVPAAGSVRRANSSNYRLKLPAANLPAAQLAIETSARIFQRGVQLSVVRAADRRSRNARLETMVATTWGHLDPEEASQTLTVSISPGDASEIWLAIDEGDNSPLPITGVRLLLPSYRLRFYRPAGSALRLVYGRTDLLAPRYDLALVSEELLNAQAEEVTPLPERSADAARRPLLSPLRFWSFLVIAVAILIGLIIRLVNRPAAQKR